MGKAILTAVFEGTVKGGRRRRGKKILLTDDIKTATAPDDGSVQSLSVGDIFSSFRTLIFPEII